MLFLWLLLHIYLDFRFNAFRMVRKLLANITTNIYLREVNDEEKREEENEEKISEIIEGYCYYLLSINCCILGIKLRIEDENYD